MIDTRRNPAAWSAGRQPGRIVAALLAVLLAFAQLSAVLTERRVMAASSPSSSAVQAASTASALDVYVDALSGGWGDWSWDPISRNLANASPVHGGTSSIAVTYTGGWSALQLGRNTALGISGYDAFRFWFHGGSSGGQQIEVRVGNDSAYVKQNMTLSAVAGPT